MSELCELSPQLDSQTIIARPMRRNEDLLCEAFAVPRILSCSEGSRAALGLGEPHLRYVQITDKTSMLSMPVPWRSTLALFRRFPHKPRSPPAASASSGAGWLWALVFPNC